MRLQDIRHIMQDPREGAGWEKDLKELWPVFVQFNDNYKHKVQEDQ